MRAALIAFLAWSAAAPALRAQELVTPVRVGRPDAATTLSVWAQQDYSHLAARPAIANVFTDVFTDWARAHPDVQLRVSVMPALELHKAKLQLAAAAGRLPDVASIDSFWMPLLADAVQPLDEFWPADDRRDFLPFTIQTLSNPVGRVLGMWHETDCRVLFYRRDLVPAPPATWDALLDVASRIAASGISPATSTTPAAGKRPCSITWRCSGRRAASSSLATAGRFSPKARTAGRCCGC